MADPDADLDPNRDSGREAESVESMDPAAIIERQRAILRTLLNRPQRMRQWNLERVMPFSWLHCAISVFSYVLMLSDVLRTGFGLHDLSSYTAIEADSLLFFGPYAYPVTKELFKNATTDGSTHATPFWPYKYDSTSVVMRAVAKHLNIREWPQCVTYDASCDELAGIPPTAVFAMIDSLVESVKNRAAKQDERSQVGDTGSGRLMLRLTYRWDDRLHDYVFPWFFTSLTHRSSQAIYYDPHELRSPQRQRLGSLCNSMRRHRLLACEESWTNFHRLCTESGCADVHTVGAHMTTRLLELQRKYPAHDVDFVLLEGMDDTSRGGLTYQGSKWYEVVALARIRKCSVVSDAATTNATVCETVAVDDYRYEAASFTINAPNWLGVTAMIRGVGQLYAWIRLCFLLVGCYTARASEPRMQQSSALGRLLATVRTVFLLPSQVMIYGSLFPISCYAFAHLIDAAAVYGLMGQQLTSFMGAISLDFSELVRVCAVSMRSLWILAIFCHVFQSISTRCVWSPIHGVPGIPEFSISFVACLTILAQFRQTWLRDSRVVQVVELVPGLARQRWNSEHFDAVHSSLYKLLFGTVIDYKCLAASIILHFVLVLVIRVLHYLLPCIVKYQLVTFTQSGVPYSANFLWPIRSLVVSWHSTFFKRPALRMRRAAVATIDVGSRRLLMPAPYRRHVSLCSNEYVPATTTDQINLHDVVEKRTREAEAVVFLMNLGVMTDPLTFLLLRLLDGKRIGVYQSKRSERCVLLPMALVAATCDIPIDWSELELRLEMNTRDLDWWDLMQCG